MERVLRMLNGRSQHSHIGYQRVGLGFAFFGVVLPR